MTSITRTVDLRWHGEETNKDEKWELLSPVVAAYNDVDDIVPPGFRTDLASIPRLLRSITPQVGNHIPAAIWHDWAYRNGHVPRKEADRRFREFMDCAGVYGLRRWSMWAAVRSFGWLAYKGQ